MAGITVSEGVKVASESSYEISFFYRNVRCRERIALKPTAPNLKRVINHRGAILSAIEDGSFDYSATFPKSPRRLQFCVKPIQGDTVEFFLEAWLAGKKPMVKASTWNDYRKIVRFVLVPNLGHMPLADLDRPAVRTMCTKIKAGNKRIANVLSVLRDALGQAVTDNQLEHNVVDGWTYAKAEPVREHDEDELDVFTAAEQAAVLAHMSPRNANFFRFAFWTGLRTSEQIALEWKDIDFTEGVIRVVRAQTAAARREGIAAEAPKTKAGRRKVKMLTGARSALTAQREHTQMAGKRVWHINTDEAVREIFKLACTKAQVRYRNPYQTRHTYASMMLTAGESVPWVSQQMGHADQGMVQRVYGHFIPGSHPNAGSLAERMFGG